MFRNWLGKYWKPRSPASVFITSLRTWRMLLHEKPCLIPILSVHSSPLFIYCKDLDQNARIRMHILSWGGTFLLVRHFLGHQPIFHFCFFFQNCKDSDQTMHVRIHMLIKNFVGQMFSPVHTSLTFYYNTMPNQTVDAQAHDNLKLCWSDASLGAGPYFIYVFYCRKKNWPDCLNPCSAEPGYILPMQTV